MAPVDLEKSTEKVGGDLGIRTEMAGDMEKKTDDAAENDGGKRDGGGLENDGYRHGGPITTNRGNVGAFIC